MTRNTCRIIGCAGRPEQSPTRFSASTKRYSEEAASTPTPWWAAPRQKEKAKEQDAGKEKPKQAELE
eukprot:9544952-Prorocentrum_lima.AAC.1